MNVRFERIDGKLKLNDGCWVILAEVLFIVLKTFF